MERHLTQSCSCNHRWRFLCIPIRVYGKQLSPTWDFPRLLVGMQNSTAILEKQLRKKVLFLKINISMYLPHDPDAAIPLLDLTRKMKTHSHKDLHVDVYSSIIHNQQNWKQPKCPSNKLDKCINKLWYITQQ